MADQLAAAERALRETYDGPLPIDIVADIRQASRGTKVHAALLKWSPVGQPFLQPAWQLLRSKTDSLLCPAPRLRRNGAVKVMDDVRTALEVSR
jgi:hypothetical protein